MGLLRAVGALFFDLADQDDAQAEVAASALRTKCTVLVIDDDDAVLEVVRTALREAGFNVLSTSSGPKGLNMLRYAPRDIGIVLLDYSMPGFDGERTLGYVRELNPKVKIVGLTGVAPSFVPAGFRQGVDELIHKPFRATALVDSLTALLNHHAAEPATTAN